MIFGIGIDILETKRIKNSINQKGFLEKVFTAKEIEICNNSKIAYQKFTARFAAKEAFMKALGTGWRKGVKFKEIEIRNNSDGMPYIILYGKTKEIAKKLNINKIHLSMSHIKEYANSIVILEK